MVKRQLIYVKMGKQDELVGFDSEYRIFIGYYPCVLTIMKFNNNGHEKKNYADFESELVQWLTNKVL